MSVSARAIAGSFVSSRSSVQTQRINEPGRFGEKPFAQLVDDAFDKAHLKWSRRLKLMEEAQERKIGRGEAIAVIKAAERRRAKQFKLESPTGLRAFGMRYAMFAAGYLALAIAWCVVMSLA